MLKKLMLSATVFSLMASSMALAQDKKTKPNKGDQAVAEIDVEWTSCSSINVTSSKDISNIVIEVDGEQVKFDDLSGTTFSHDELATITNVWVKSGNNQSGDGPGYGQLFNLTAPMAVLDVTVTADDQQNTYINGQLQSGPNENYWGRSDTYTVDIPACEEVVIAVQARDVARVAAAMIGDVKLNGNVVSTTGDGQWLTTNIPPAATWFEPAFDDSSWYAAQKCSSVPWGTHFQTTLGADWIWHSTNCKDFRTAWYRLKFFANI